MAGHPNVGEVDRRLAGRWIEEEFKPRELGVSTKQWYIGALKAAWTYFVLNGTALSNPWERMNTLVQESSKGVEKKEPRRAWTQDEIEKLKDVPKHDPIYAVSVIRLHSGIRVEEACSLRVDDIDLTANTLSIRAGKTRSSVRTLPLHPVLQSLLPELIENATEDGYLFDMKPAGKDKKRSHNFDKRIGRWIRANVSKDKGVVSYTLRHTYSQAMRDLGVDRETIEFTTGHKDQSMLFGTYATEVAVARLREAVEKLDFGF